jgi:hypothetical protein
VHLAVGSIAKIVRFVGPIKDSSHTPIRELPDVRGEEVKRFVKARTPHVRGTMNKSEAAYQLWLESQKQRGHIKDVLPFESITLVIGNGTRYTPDFPVVELDETISMRDVKGTKNKKDESGNKIGTQPYVEETANVKIRVAAEKFPFRFIQVWLDKNQGWMEREF